MRSRNCVSSPSVESAFELLGKRWTGLIVAALMNGPRRFKEVADGVPGVSDRMLSERFKELEEAGVVRRIVYPETPVRIEYMLTERGRALQPVIREIQTWAERYAAR
ncbi:winged helix-turn-helix transcriptional regulator [Paenibacillus sp.]|uniref:winged helix-turn-helix transcriptional regulator n=1 Tax=Paenibacillus sp. TaxID=58172 RepID=UPI002D702281|nr:winged helix-turn-helix transcriptional regulator [Paenibacillus sp.]HZG57773.1 winged helix-turn-helix transcriptional regulator [Paenibacillus sp.]